MPTPRKRPTAAGAAPPKAAIDAMQAAVAAHRAGRLSDAIAAYRQAIKMAPALAEAHYNLGVALKMVGQGRAAAKALTDALRLRPTYARAHAALAGLHDASGNTAKALRHWLEAYQHLPDDPGVLTGVVSRLGTTRFAEADPRLAEIVTSLLRRDDVEGQRLAGAALSLLSLDADTQAALDRFDPGLLPVSPLLLAALERTIVADRAWERLLTEARAQTLQSFKDLDDPKAPFVRALAAQMLTTEYAFACSPAEAATLERLNLSGDDLTSDHVRFALYAPLAHQVRALEAPADWRVFVDVHLTRPVEERDAIAAVPALTPIADGVSQAVRDQYTALPYPRWSVTRAITAQPRRVVAGAIAGPERSLPPDPSPLRVLVAGCGTGKHAVDVATRFANADVLAIDLSRTALGYATAQARRMGIENLRFAEADILALGTIGQTFDHIESVGVLHHMAEPIAGWRVLRGLLAENGTMRIGLYSRRGRAAIQAAQSVAVKFPNDAEGLRALRRHIQALPPDHPAAPVCQELDFYTLSGVRDALAHAHEHDFTLLEIRDMLQAMDLEFMGFEAITADQGQRQGGRPASGDPLAEWDAREQANPDLFHLMYQFWCQPRQ